MGSESSPISIKYMMKMLIILGILRNEIMNIVKRPLTHYKQTKKYKEQIYTNEWWLNIQTWANVIGQETRTWKNICKTNSITT